MSETDFLDAEEQELVGTLETDGWKSTADFEGWKTLLSKTAANTNTLPEN